MSTNTQRKLHNAAANAAFTTRNVVITDAIGGYARNATPHDDASLLMLKRGRETQYGVQFECDVVTPGELYKLALQVKSMLANEVKLHGLPKEFFAPLYGVKNTRTGKIAWFTHKQMKYVGAKRERIADVYEEACLKLGLIPDKATERGVLTIVSTQAWFQWRSSEVVYKPDGSKDERVGVTNVVLKDKDAHTYLLNAWHGRLLCKLFTKLRAKKLADKQARANTKTKGLDGATVVVHKANSLEANRIQFGYIG